MQKLRKYSRLSPAKILAGASLISLAAAGASGQGLTYDMKMAMQKGVGPAPSDTQIVMAGHGKFQDGNSRMDMTESVMPGSFMGKGTYIILKNGTRNEWIVDPEKHQYIEINVDSAAHFSVGSMNLGGLIKMEMTDATVDMQPLGPGESLQGYSTMKYRVTSNFTSTISVFGRKKKSKNTTTTDIWIAPQLAGLYNPAAAPQGGGSELGQKMAAAYAKMGRGAVIKAVSQTQSSGDHASAMTMTMEITNIKHARVASSAFDAPNGYTKIDGTAALAALGGGGGKDGKSGSFGDQLVDSAKQGAKQGAADEVKNQAKDKAKRVLGGIFGRP